MAAGSTILSLKDDIESILDEHNPIDTDMVMTMLNSAFEERDDDWI